MSASQQISTRIIAQSSFDIPLHDNPCNLCGSEQRHPYCPENGLRLVQCEDCGLVYVNPRPDPHELYALYGETYFRNEQSGVVGYTNYLKDEANIRKTFAGRLKRISRFIKPGKLLDVGCAAGFFLDEARKIGWQVQGLDVSSFAVRYAAEHFGVDVQPGSLTDLNYPANSYDLISMWDVIEHVPDPKAYIRRAAKLLKQDGLLVMATPDVGSIPARVTGKRWVGYKLSEEHVYYFSARTLGKMLAEEGFDVIDVRHVGKYVTVRLFLDRLGMYLPLTSQVLQVVERAFKVSAWSAYVNPFDIIAVTARKRQVT